MGWILKKSLFLFMHCDHQVLNINDRKLLIALRSNVSIRGPGQVSEP